MQLCNRIYYFTVHWRLNMFRAAYRSSSGAPNVFAASGLPTHVVTGRSQVWVKSLRLDYGRSPHAYVNQRLQIQLQLLMMSGMPLETFWAFNERWNNKFCYKDAFRWLFLLSHNSECFQVIMLEGTLLVCTVIRALLTWNYVICVHPCLWGGLGYVGMWRILGPYNSHIHL
jgi:hypothetical protein